MRSTTLRTAILLAAVVAVALPAGCSQQGATPQTPASAPQASGAPPAAAVKVGTETKSGDWTLKVDRVFRAGAAGGAIPPEGKELLVVEMTLTHKGKAEGIGPTAFKLKDSSGKTIPAAQTSDQDYIFNIEQPLKADTPTQVKIAYMVPKGAAGHTLTFEPFIEGGPTQPVDVTLD